METPRRRSYTSSGWLSENKLRAMWLCQSLVTSDVSPASPLLGLELRPQPLDIAAQPSLMEDKAQSESWYLQPQHPDLPCHGQP